MLRSSRGARHRVGLDARDHGVGWDPSSPTRGRGMKSLKMRARKLGGELRVDTADPGLHVFLRFPR